MSILEFISLIIFFVAIWYWLNAMRAKEIASAAGLKKCKSQGVDFLDETVVLRKVRLRRNSAGHLVVYREYQFEFSSDGSHRYLGMISLLGKQLIAIDMEAYRDSSIH
ncbi:MAG: DUF3301 domain-containing protein [Gammaproteobacteria bacterium]|nr:DUF3301 domain-containing protein [Gammaproteobacteria bacterium]MDH5777486.1 DUF3301 domain-containing protein [Gammaproteobacteria bacterium]